MQRFLIAGILTLSFVIPGLAENWPQWRGPKNDGISTEKDLPTEWTEVKNVVWKLPLPGQGESTPCVWDDHIFLTSMSGTDVVLLCLDTAGKERWRKTMANSSQVRLGPDKASEATASCSTDGKHVWAFVGGRNSGRLACFDFAGTLVWEKNIQEYGKFSIQFGVHWTPALYQGKLYLQVMHRGAQKVVRLDAATGKEDWAVERPGFSKGESPDVYASAFVWEGDGGPLLIAHGNDYCTAHKLDDGAEVWRVNGLNPTTHRAWRFVSCPVVTPNLIVVPSCKNGPTVGINPVGAKGAIEPGNKAELWRFKSTPDAVSPLVVGDVVYLMSDGPLTALDAKTGDQIYRKDLTNSIHRSNLVCADGKVYAVARDGTTDVVQAGRDFKLLSTNKLPDKFSASPVISGGRIYLRGWENLWAIGTK